MIGRQSAVFLQENNIRRKISQSQGTRKLGPREENT